MGRKQRTEQQEYARLVRDQEKRDRKNRRIYGPPREVDDNDSVVTVGGTGASTTFFRAFFGG